MGASASRGTINCLRWMANPGKPPSNLPLLVMLRVITLMTLLSSMVILSISLLLRPWKLAMYRGDRMEIGVWTICRITTKVYQCFPDWYDSNPITWFLFWRYMMIVSVAIDFFAFTFLCIQLARLKRLDPKPWIIGSIACCTAGLFNFTSFVLFYFKFEWEFAEVNFGWTIMGWNEESPDMDGFVETTGYPYIMAWVSEILILIAAYLCFYTRCQEQVFIDEEIANKKHLQILEKQKEISDLLTEQRETDQLLDYEETET